MQKVSATTEVATLAQSLRHVLEANGIATVSAIGKESNYRTIKAIGALNSMFAETHHVQTHIEWQTIGAGTTEERIGLLYTITLKKKG